MSRKTASLLVGLVAGAAVAGVVIASVLGRGGGEEEGSLDLGGEPVAVSATLTPSRPFFGDRVLATLSVRLDRRLVDPKTVAVRVPVRPFRRVGPIEGSRRDAGPLTLLTYTVPMQCIDRACAVRAGVEPIRLLPAVVHYFPAGGELGIDHQVAWPEVVLASRGGTGAGQTGSAAEASTQDAPAISYRVDPDVLGWLAVALAGVLVLAVGGVVSWRLRTDGPAPADAEGPEELEVSSLERSLELVAEAASSDDVAARRATLQALSRQLETGDGLAVLAPRARRLAWSARAPDPDAMLELTSAVRRAREGRP